MISVGGHDYKINAVTVPEFDLTVNVPNLDKVISVFKNKGYTLADKTLSGSQIAGVGFLLGSNYAGILPVSSKTFSISDDLIPSSFFVSSLGVMLQGSADLMLENSAELENVDPL